MPVDRSDGDSERRRDVRGRRHAWRPRPRRGL